MCFNKKGMGGASKTRSAKKIKLIQIVQESKTIFLMYLPVQQTKLEPVSEQ